MPGRCIAVIQSNYIPWKGYFDLINQVDELVLYDDVQYTKNDWRNRNRVKTPQGAQWMSIPVRMSGKFGQSIAETLVSNQSWRLKHWKTICQNYSKAEHFRDYAERFEAAYLDSDERYLSRINRGFLELVCSVLGVETPLRWSSELDLPTGRCERLVALCRELGAREYLSGPAARDYLDEGSFAEQGIAVRWMDYSDYPEYRQLFPPFVHEVSIIDLIFNEGPRARDFMKSF